MRKPRNMARKGAPRPKVPPLRKHQMMEKQRQMQFVMNLSKRKAM